jgi:hypothetical protein
MIEWNDFETALDPVGFARRRLGFEPGKIPLADARGSVRHC